MYGLAAIAFGVISLVWRDFGAPWQQIQGLGHVPHREILVFLAAAIQHTKRLRLGPLLYVTPMYHPLRLAEEVVMLDHMSGGRLELGLGRGASPIEIATYAVDPETAPQRNREATEVILKALDNDILDHFQNLVDQAGGGNYQTLMNNALREYIRGARLEAVVLRVEVEVLDVEQQPGAGLAANQVDKVRIRKFRFRPFEQVGDVLEQKWHRDARLDDAHLLDDVLGHRLGLGQRQKVAEIASRNTREGEMLAIGRCL